MGNVFGQPTYPKVKFNTTDASRETYKQFMEALRHQLASEDESHAIPLLRDPSSVPDNRRYLLVEIANSRNLTITLALDITNAYVVAYRVGNQSYFFSDHVDPARSYVFTDTQQNILPFGSNYNSIGEPANTDLGIFPLDEAVSSLHGGRYQGRSLLVCIQMVSEAARFKYIERRVHWSIERNQRFRPDACMLSLENNWGALSTAIQGSDDNGNFTRPVRLVRSNLQELNVVKVTTELVANMALMLFRDNSKGKDSKHRHDEL
uniref:rRNA N-glycosylase n=1 Tax=Triadica sebifera TaxID=139772 RepID=A0A0D3QSV1_TRISB|nr:sebin [Triadica sebifera]